MKYFLYVLAVVVPVLTFSQSAFSQPVYLVDDQNACPELLRRFNVHPDQPTYAGDLEQCQSARRACAGVRDILAKHCVEKMGHEYGNELDYQSNINTARARSTPVDQGGYGEGIEAIGNHMKSFCPGYLTKKASQVDFCKKADDMCDDGAWKLSSGSDIVCDLFSVKREEYMNVERSTMRLCKFARDVHNRIFEENKDRVRTCGEYGAVQGAAFGNGVAPAPGDNSGDFGPPMDSGDAGYAAEGDTNLDGVVDGMDYIPVPSPNQNSAFEKMPEKGLVDQFFDMFR